MLKLDIWTIKMNFERLSVKLSPKCFMKRYEILAVTAKTFRGCSSRGTPWTTNLNNSSITSFAVTSSSSTVGIQTLSMAGGGPVETTSNGMS